MVRLESPEQKGWFSYLPVQTPAYLTVLRRPNRKTLNNKCGGKTQASEIWVNAFLFRPPVTAVCTRSCYFLCWNFQWGLKASACALKAFADSLVLYGLRLRRVILLTCIPEHAEKRILIYRVNFGLFWCISETNAKVCGCILVCWTVMGRLCCR